MTERWFETRSITVDAAIEIVRTAIAVGAAQGVRVVATVVDPALAMVAFGRADGATPHSTETSRRKAVTAASTRRASGWMEGDFATQAPLGTGLLLTNIAGGVPLGFGGVQVGGLGIAGGAPAQDAAIARAVLEEVGADLP